MQGTITAVVSLSFLLLLPSTRLLGRALEQPALVLSGQKASRSVDKLNQALKSYQVLESNLPLLVNEVKSSGRLRVVLEDVPQDLVLELNDLYAPGIRWTMTTDRGEVDVPVPPPSTYKGSIKGVPNSQVRLLIQVDLFFGYIRRGTDYLFIEPLLKYSPEAQAGQLVVYHESDIQPGFEGLCGAAALHNVGLQLSGPQMIGKSSFVADVADVTFRFLQVATDADYDMFLAPAPHGGTGTNTYILGIMNQLDGIYRTNLNIGVIITFQNVYATSNNPYTSNDTSTLLGQFVTTWTTNHTGVTRDVAHLFTGKTLNGNIVGAAYLSTACNKSYEYGVTTDTTSFTVKIVAHEIGHNLGASHDDQDPAPLLPCPGDGMLMCASVQPSGLNQFSQKTIDATAAYIAAASTSSCLAPLWGAPIIITNPATNVQTSMATLNATVDPNGISTTVAFQYGSTVTNGSPAYGSTTADQAAGSGTDDIYMLAAVAPLLPNTTYHYQAMATNSVATVYGSDVTFTTGSAIQPTGITIAATNVKSTTATLNATVNPNGAATNAYFQWGTTSSYGNNTPVQSLGSGTSVVPISAGINGLQPNITYHYQLVATNVAGTTYGGDNSFTTAGCAVSVAPSPISFMAAGGSGTMMISASDSNCPWAMSSTESWMTIASGASGVGSGSVSYMLSANPTPALREGQLLVAGTTSTVVQNGVGDLGFNSALSSGAVISQLSQGQGPLSVSYGVITGSGSTPPVSLANFGLTANGVLISEVGIPASNTLTRARLFVDYSSTTNSGIAVVNPGISPIAISLVLRGQDGIIVSTATLTLGPGAHTAKFVDQLGLSLPVPFLGTLTLSSNSPFAAVNLLSATSGRGDTLYSALPLVDLDNVSTGNSLIFPQILDGDGSPTQILLMNPSDSLPSSGQMAFYADDGSPVALDFGPDIGVQSSMNFQMPQMGMLKYSTTGQGPLQVGYVVITQASGALPVGSSIFSMKGSSGPASQAGVLNAVPGTMAELFVDVACSPLARNTGIALANSNSTPANLRLTLMGTDGSSRTGKLTIVANGHVAKFITELFSGLPGEFQGVLTIASDVPVAPLTLRLTTNQRGETIASTLPGAAAGVNLAYPLIVPQIVDGGGYQTQFILLNPSLTPEQIRIDFLNDNGIPVGLPLN
jgi:hypothetical protein